MTITSATLVWIPNHKVRTVTGRHSRGVARRAKTTWIRLALVGLGHASPDSVGALNISGQAGTLRVAIAQHGAAGVGTAW